MADEIDEDFEAALEMARPVEPTIEPEAGFEEKKNGIQDDTPLPESPASLNIKFWAAGYGVMLTMRAKTVHDVLVQFQQILPFIQQAGYKNVWDKEPVIERVLPAVKPNESVLSPRCGIHGSYMEWKTGVSKKTGKPYAFWSCPIKNADGTWCKYQPPKG